MDKKTPKTHSIEIIPNSSEGKSSSEIFEEEELDWEMDQQVVAPTSEEELLKKPRYGFNDMHSNYFGALQDELKELLQLKDPDSVPSNQRNSLRIQYEDSHFNPESYM